MTLVEFLLARIAEDKQIAQAATPGPWVRWDAPDVTAVAATETSLFGTPVTPSVWVVSGSSGLLPSDATHIALHDPARVLAECAAKRQIVKLHTPRVTARACAEGATYESCPICDPYPPMEDPNPGPCDTLRLLATLYADHPDYQEEWKP